MERDRQLELYRSETSEHLRLLSRGILALESGAAGAVEEAFRAAHTLKGLAAAMGYGRVTDLAHRLEDRLASVRGASGPAPHDLIDELLAAADALAAAIANPDSDAAGASAAQVDTAPSRADDPRVPSRENAPPAPPQGTVLIARVMLDPAETMPAARAAVIRQNAERAGGVLDVWPARGVDTREVRLYLAATADQVAIERAVKRAGAVHEVRFEVPPVQRALETASPDRETSLVRVDRARLDELAEGVAELSVLHERGRTGGEGAHRDGWYSDRVGALLASLRRTVIDMRMVPVGAAFERFRRLIRDAARVAGRDIDFEIEGGDIELDQAILDAVIDPIVHLLRNAVDHGVEPAADRLAGGKPERGRIGLEAARDRSSVRIMVRDDGRGVSRERVLERATQAGLAVTGDGSGEDLLRLLAHPGLSTATQVTALSGRGVGLDVVVNRIRSLGGAIGLESTAGAGTTFTLRLPLTLAIVHALRIRIGAEDYAIPLTHVTEAVALDPGVVYRHDTGRESIRVREQTVPLVRLGRVLGYGDGSESAAVVAEAGDRRIALGVDELVGHEQIVVKPFDPPIGALPVFSGVTILADGRPALLIDPLSVA
ncbi:MAG: chemotaxis protein CheA [Gemmatimonadetes bacterium]|nr:chemotaxis protein CheA [Gemmatimonadota bacterium]